MLLTLRSQFSTTSARAAADAVITALSPAAWYRNATDVVSSGGFASIWADYASSDKGLVLPGVNGNYASTPDAAPVSVTGDISILVRVRLNDYTPASAQAMVYKIQTAGQYSYGFTVNSTFPGRLSFFYSPDGTVLREAISSADNGVTDGDATWFKVTYNSSTGKVNYYKAADSVSIPSSWTTIGAEQTLTSGAIFDGNTALGIGASSSGLIPCTGTFYRAIIYSDLAETTKVFDADFSAQAIGTGSFTESSSNAATVTINASGASPAHIGKARDLLQGTGTNQPAYAAGVFTFDGADNYMAASFALSQPITVVLIGSQVSWTANDTIYDAVTGNTMRCYQRTATPTISQYAGLQGGQDANWAVGADGIVVVVFSGASSTIRVNNNAKTTGSAGTSASDGFTLGAFGGGASFANITAKEAVLFGSALSDADVDDVVTAYNSLFTVF